jgi:serine protease Do
MIKTKLLINLVIAGILMLSSNSVFAAVSLPDEVPSIATQTAQKDKAAVVLISSVVTGLVSWPSFTMKLAVDENILGTWQHPAETVIFNADGRFSCITIDENELSGTYATEGNSITLYYAAPVIITEDFTYTISGNTLTLNEYSYTKISEETTDDDIVAIAENFMFVMETGINAALETDVISSGASGTGFIISPDGHIITNAHVVLAGEDLTDMIAIEFVYNLTDAFSEEFSQYYDIAQEDQEAIVEILVDKFVDYFVENNGDITDITTDYYVVNGVPSPGEDIEAKSWPAVVKNQGTAYTEVGEESSWGEDIAIIKVEKNGLPTVNLGDSSKVQVGDSVFIIGYPTIGLEEFFQPESILEPTVTQGMISAKRTLKTGVETFQTDAAINHGNSGGPAYNDKGEVIGIATFGAGPETGIEAIKFMMPINLAKEFMEELNIENEHSVLDTKYAEALNAFWNRDCYTTIDKMNEVLVLYPDHPYAQEYIDECNRAIVAGEVSEPETPGFELILAVCVIALILFWKRRR